MVTAEVVLVQTAYFISIHTTAKVVTHSLCTGHRCYPISIHTTAKVVTLMGILGENTIVISIHTTAKVVTDRGAVTKSARYNFNPHHREGGDLSLMG